MDPAELERWVGDELKKLPAPQAPRTLAPRVLAAVRSARPETRAPESWVGWTLAQQVLSVAALVAGAAAVAGLWLIVREPLFGALSLPVAAVSTRVEHVQQQAYDITLAARVLWRVLEPFAVGVVALVAIMFAACAAIGAALRNIAVGGTSA